jgi:hypothetical protein
MSHPDIYRRKAEDLLRQATQAGDMAVRGRLLDEALHWHHLAMDAAGHPDQRLHDNDEDDGEDAARAG